MNNEQVLALIELLKTAGEGAQRAFIWWLIMEYIVRGLLFAGPLTTLTVLGYRLIKRFQDWEFRDRR